MTKKLKSGSLFSGYGGLSRAVEKVFNAETVWVSDIDKASCRVLEKVYPGVPNLGDVTTVDWSLVEPVDIIEGGSPCQDMSMANVTRDGMIEGKTRSGLWSAMRDAVDALKPTYVVWENVHGALSAKASSQMEYYAGLLGDDRPQLRAVGRVLGDLADLGYDAVWRSLRVSEIGGGMDRARVFLLAVKR